MRKLLLTLSHTAALCIGFALGVYLLPIIIQPPAPNIAAVESKLSEPVFTAYFDRNRKGSDTLHWGDGEIRFFQDTIVFEGALAPGPDYRLYLVPMFVEDEAAFLAVKDQSHEVGSIKNFDRFVFDGVSALENPAFTSVVVWCETFGEFITSGQYR